MKGLGLEARCLSVWTPGGEPILRCIDVKLEPGSLLLVTGASGAGKTTLLRALAGLATSVHGLRVEGEIIPEDVDNMISYVPQEPWFALATPYVLTELLVKGIAEAEARAILDGVGLSSKIDQLTTSLSAGEAQRLALAVALAEGRRIVLVDEVTSYLDDESRKGIIDLLRRIADEGVAVAVVDHDVRSWGSVDSVLYLDGGRSHLYRDPRETPVYRASLELEGEIKAKPGGDAVLEADSLWYRYPDSREYVIRDMSATARRGDIIWIRGPSGSGKSTLLKLLSGLYRPSRGRLNLHVRPQLVPENPLLYFSEPTVGDELGGDPHIADLAGLEHAMDRPIGALSSGERRRLAIASAYSRSPGLLFVDEPTVGLDPWNSRRIMGLLVDLADRGSTMIVASHGKELGLVATGTVVAQ